MEKLKRYRRIVKNIRITEEEKILKESSRDYRYTFREIKPL